MLLPDVIDCFIFSASSSKFVIGFRLVSEPSSLSSMAICSRPGTILAMLFSCESFCLLSLMLSFWA
jgi:hypothetical protein